MGPVHVEGKQIATGSPKLKTTKETRMRFELINALKTQLPHVRMSFQDKQTMRSIVERLDKSTKKEVQTSRT
jgi:hypothetical protein